MSNRSILVDILFSKLFLVFSLLVLAGCGKGKNENSSNSEEIILPSGFFRLSSASAATENGELMIFTVTGDLVQKITAANDTYTIKQSGYAELTYGIFESAIGCPESSSGATKWQFKLDNEGTAVEGQQLVSTCKNQGGGEVSPSEVS